ncbi:hypothetical protein K438DRAFT_2101865 [Mycena galopus ATCC 62051]|nr:hypothetical protein K438DRAFT_2101865 [Mycena galopus ATCC 62051]
MDTAMERVYGAGEGVDKEYAPPDRPTRYNRKKRVCRSLGDAITWSFVARMFGTLPQRPLALPQTTTSSSLPTPPHEGRYRRLGPAGVRNPTQRASSYWAEYQPRPPAPQSHAPFPIATAPPTGSSPQPPTSPTPSAAATGKRKAPSLTSPSSPTLPTPSRLPRFTQSWLTATAQSCSQSTARRAASSASHTLLAPPLPPTPSSASGRRSKDEERIKYSSVNTSTKPSAGRPLAIYQSGQQTTGSPTSSDSSNGHGGDPTLARPPHRLGAAIETIATRLARIVCPSRGEHVRLIDGRYNQWLPSQQLEAMRDDNFGWMQGGRLRDVPAKAEWCSQEMTGCTEQLEPQLMHVTEGYLSTIFSTPAAIDVTSADAEEMGLDSSLNAATSVFSQLNCAFRSTREHNRKMVQCTSKPLSSDWVGPHIRKSLGKNGRQRDIPVEVFKNGSSSRHGCNPGACSMRAEQDRAGRGDAQFIFECKRNRKPFGSRVLFKYQLYWGKQQVIACS